MPTPLDAGRDPLQIGPYLLLERLGEGGQGVVYLAEAADGRKVAVKTLKLEGLSPADDRAARRRLAREVEAAMRVDPFCTAQVLDFSVEGPLPYVVSEYVPGPSLQQRVEEEGPLSEGGLVRLIIQSVTGLTAIHNAGIVHRDLKPSNLLLGPDGARVVDFGIARPAESHTHTRRLIGTPSYFSPEQLQGRPATMASDVFAWAGTMVFAATGRAPFGHADYESRLPALFRRIVEEEPDLRGVPERVLPLLRLCLDKDPERRPAAWSILGWLLGRSPAGSDARPPDTAPADKFTQEAAKILGRAPQDERPLQLPPPGPPPAGLQAPPQAEPFPFPFAGHAQASPEYRSVPASGHRASSPAGGEAAAPGGGQSPPAGHEPAPDREPASSAERKPASTTRMPTPQAERQPASGGEPVSSAEREPASPTGSNGAPTARKQTPQAGGEPAPSGGGKVSSRAQGSGPSGTRGSASPAGEETVPPADERTIPPDEDPVPSPERREAPKPRRRTLALPAVALAVAVVAGGGWLVLRPGGDSTPRIPDRLAGTWRGPVSEGDGFTSATNEVTLSLPAGQETGTLSGSRCSGMLRVDRVDGDRLFLKFTSGPCEHGEVRVYPSGDGLYYMLHGGGHDTGDGTLHRSGP